MLPWYIQVCLWCILYVIFGIQKGNYQQQFYMELVRRACKSMLDELNEQEKQNNEYKEHINNLIHEVR